MTQFRLSQVILRNVLERLFADQIYGFTLMVFYCGLVSYYRINLFITFTKQQWGESRFFLFEQHPLPLFINCDRQTVLCLMFIFLFCNCFVPFVPLISSRNCTLFFSVFVNFIFSNFKTILLCLHVIPLVSFNNSFIVNLQQILNFQHVSFIHTYTDEGIQFQNISVWKKYVIFDVHSRHIHIYGIHIELKVFRLHIESWPKWDSNPRHDYRAHMKFG